MTLFLSVGNEIEVWESHQNSRRMERGAYTLNSEWTRTSYIGRDTLVLYFFSLISDKNACTRSRLHKKEAGKNLIFFPGHVFEGSSLKFPESGILVFFFNLRKNKKISTQPSMQTFLPLRKKHFHDFFFISWHSVFWNGPPFMNHVRNF